MGTPPLPTSISADGREVWAWADGLSKWSRRQQKKRDLREHLGPNRCGECRLWMTRSCPRERNDVDGRNYGPSSKGLVCDQFQINEHDMKLRAEKQAELDALIAEDAGDTDD